MKDKGKTNLNELNEFVGAIALLQGATDIIKEADTLLLKHLVKVINEELKNRAKDTNKENK